MKLEQFKCEVCPYKQKWIPVSERSPEIAGYEVLATLENKFGQRHVTVVFTGYGSGDFWNCNHKEYDLNVWKVVAWMPLPKTYKEEGDQDG